MKPHNDINQDVIYQSSQPSENLVVIDKQDYNKSYFNYNEDSEMDRYFDQEENEYKPNS